MKAIITKKSELTIGLKQWYTFNVLSNDGEELLTNQNIETTPSQAIADIKAKIAAFEEEYEKSQELTEGMEIS